MSFFGYSFLLSLVVWISERATQNDKRKNSRFCDLKILGYKKLQNKNLGYYKFI